MTWPLTCKSCHGELEMMPDVMNDEDTPACPNVDCSIFGQTQLPEEAE